MTINRRAPFSKLDSLLFKALESASTLCKLRGNPYIELAHWLNQIVLQDDSDLHHIFAHHHIDIRLIQDEIAAALNQLPSGATAINDFSPHVDMAIERSWHIASLHYRSPVIRSVHLLHALLDSAELRPYLHTIIPSLHHLSAEQLHDAQSYLDSSPEASGITTQQGMSHSTSGETKNNVLEQYCTDLTEQARNGKIDPVIGREHDIHTMTDILLRRRQNNPLITGEAGVGKTAVVEGLALAIAEQRVPDALCNTRLLSLDIGALLAGAGMKGEFEARLKSILTAINESEQSVILFIDEIHTLVGAGGQAGTGDAANLLKPALARGNLRTIGATTWSEYKKHIEKDPALTRRFQMLQINEPDPASAITMVRGLAAAFATHHKVMVTDDAIRAAVNLSHRYIPSRQLPDKAISLLDTACARVALSQQSTPARLAFLQQQLEAGRTEYTLLTREQRFGMPSASSLAELASHINALESQIEHIREQWEQEKLLANSISECRVQLDNDEQDDAILSKLQEYTRLLSILQGEQGMVMPEVNAHIVARVVSDWTGIPAGKMVRDDIAILRDLDKTLSSRVIGQEHALQQISRKIQIARTQLADPHKPAGVFLLTGPSGIGKTETALALSDALFGGEQNLITINMGEFQEAHTVSTLKGAPPGYVGYGEGGILTEAVRRKPYSVVLLDEIEKAHPDVWEVFYQVFDKGTMEDGEGRHINFRNTIILLTTNVGDKLISSLFSDPAIAPDPESITGKLYEELIAVFPTAFMGRLTIIPYLPLQSDSMAVIVRLQLDRIVKRMQLHHGVMLSIDDSIIDHITSHCQQHETGARNLIRYIEQKILPILAMFFMDQEIPLPSGTSMHLVMQGNDITVRPFMTNATDLQEKP